MVLLDFIQNFVSYICGREEDTLKAVKMSILLNPRRFQTEKILDVPFVDVFAVYHTFTIAKKYVLLLSSLEHFNMSSIIALHANRHIYQCKQGIQYGALNIRLHFVKK